MKQGSDIQSQILAWCPLIVVIVALITGMAMRSAVEEVAVDSTEMMETISHVDSPASLRTIIVTLNGQYVRAEQEWSQTLSIMAFLLFAVSVIAIIMWVRLHVLWRQRQKQPDS